MSVAERVKERRLAFLSTARIIVTDHETYPPLIDYLGAPSGVITAMSSNHSCPPLFTVAIAGSAAESSGMWTIQGAGADIWGSADAFHFVYRNTLLLLNGRMTVRVDDLQNTDPFAKVGP